MRVLFATAELSPLVKVGGLGDAAAGLVRALRESGTEVQVVLPDYAGRSDPSADELDVPPWVGRASASTHQVEGLGPITLVSTSTLARPHPYTDADGRGWPDNDTRFASFAAAIAALTGDARPDVLHLNDWHTAAALGLLQAPPPSVLTIHNPAYQGIAPSTWLDVTINRPEAFEWYGQFNPLTGGIALANAVVTVSPTFARELLDEETGFGLTGPLRSRGGRFRGIINGIDTSVWDPATDPYLPATFDVGTVARKSRSRRTIGERAGWDEVDGPLIGMVTRLTDQKGVDLALAVAEDLSDLEARMILLGSGDASLARRARELAKAAPDRFCFVDGFDEALAHVVFAGSDIVLVPSRFEPCGLTQMQAMRYGAIPVVTDVGGLHDTVQDADANAAGTGFVAREATVPAVRDALSRAVRAWRSTRRRGAIRHRGMTRDWSWRGPAAAYQDLYAEIMA